MSRFPIPRGSRRSSSRRSRPTCRRSCAHAAWA